jgi:hypothetical protein
MEQQCRENRYCNLCNCQKLGDEYHYVLECSFLNDKCKQLLPKYFMKRHNVVKFLNFYLPKNNRCYENYAYYTGKIPNSCSEGIILPIYKNKGSVSEPSSYRPITIQCNTLVSCLGKTFTAIFSI